MRVTIQHGLKVPGDQQFSSRQHSIAIDLDVPPEIASDKTRLKAYVESVGRNVQLQVEDALGQEHSAPESRASASHVRGHRNGRERARTRSRNGNGSNGNSRSPEASEKQRRFIRSLGQQARYTPAQLDVFCEENFGRRIQELTRRDASAFIEMLREEVA